MQKIKFTSIFLMLIVIGCSKNEAKYYLSDRNINQKTPFSDAVLHNDILYLTGQIGKNHITNQLVDGGIKNETNQVLENIKNVLEANGSSMDKVLKCTVILSDINDFAEMNAVYKTFFSKNLPARTTFAATLVGNAKIEIDVIATK